VSPWSHVKLTSFLLVVAVVGGVIGLTLIALLIAALGVDVVGW
jgi:hypothetical protein